MNIQRKCLLCGKIFYIKPSIVKRGEGKFCSLKCAHIAKGQAEKGKWKGVNNPNWKGGKIERVCLVCGKKFYVDPSDIKRRTADFCSVKCYGQWASENRTRDKVGTWKGGKKLNGYGYMQILVGKNRYIFEHRLVWEKANGKIPNGFIIHHLNGIKIDNRLENLICILRKEHSARKIIEPYQEKVRQLELEIYQIKKSIKEVKV